MSNTFWLLEDYLSVFFIDVLPWVFEYLYPVIAIFIAVSIARLFRYIIRGKE